MGIKLYLSEAPPYSSRPPSGRIPSGSAEIHPAAPEGGGYRTEFFAIHEVSIVRIKDRCWKNDQFRRLVAITTCSKLCSTTTAKIIDAAINMEKKFARKRSNDPIP
jgi:hypothetical protein